MIINIGNWELLKSRIQKMKEPGDENTRKANISYGGYHEVGKERHKSTRYTSSLYNDGEYEVEFAYTFCEICRSARTSRVTAFHNKSEDGQPKSFTKWFRRNGKSY